MCTWRQLINPSEPLTTAPEMVRNEAGRAAAANGRALPTPRQVYATVQRAVAAGMPFVLVMTAVTAFCIESNRNSSQPKADARVDDDADAAGTAAPPAEDRSDPQVGGPRHKARRSGKGSKQRRLKRRAENRIADAKAAADFLASRYQVISTGLGPAAVVDRDADEPDVSTSSAPVWCSPTRVWRKLRLGSTAALAVADVSSRSHAVVDSPARAFEIDPLQVYRRPPGVRSRRAE